MKDIQFIKKLVQEDKIQLVDTSENISSAYDKKSDNSSKAANILLRQNLLEEATS